MTIINTVIKGKLLDILKRDNEIELKDYIRNNNIKLREFNETSDILIIAIYYSVSIPIIRLILYQYQYKTLNYIKDIKEIELKVKYSPFSLAVDKENFRVADFLLKNGVDINYLKFDINNIEKRRYMISRGMNITSEVMEGLIKRKENDLLKYIFNYRVFDNNFILNLINFQKNKIFISNENLQNIILKENNKIEFNKLLYKVAIENKNYDALKLLLQNDNREKVLISKELFIILNRYCLEDKERYHFVDILKDNTLNINFTKDYLNNLIYLKERINIIIDFFKNNNFKELKIFIQNYNFPLSYFNCKFNDMLILAIEFSTSIKIINYLIKECKYETLNYCTLDGKSPFLLALSKNKFKIADLLIKNKADVNYKINNTYSILFFLYEHHQLDGKILIYLINKGVYISSDFLNLLIKEKELYFLKIIFNYYIYNIHFILQFLGHYQNRIPLSYGQIQKNLLREKNKINITEILFKDIIDMENLECLKVIYDNDERKILILKIVMNICDDPKYFLDKIKSKQLDIQVDEKVWNNLDQFNHHMEIIKNIIEKDNNVVTLKNYLKDHQIILSLDFISFKTFDFLIYALEMKKPLEMIEYIIHLYTSLNYTVNKGDKSGKRKEKETIPKSPLLCAIKENNFELANILIDNGADINYKINKDNDLFYLLYHYKFLQPQSINFLLKHNIHITSNLINEIIINEDHHLLNTIFHHFIFDSNFIIYLLHSGKNKISLSESQLKSIIMKEKNKININEINYKTGINEEYYYYYNETFDYEDEGYHTINYKFDHNYKALSLFLDYDGSPKDILLDKINNSKLIEYAFRNNNSSIIDKIINHEHYDFNKINFKNIVKEARNFNENKLFCHFFEKSLDNKFFNFKQRTSIIKILSDLLDIDKPNSSRSNYSKIKKDTINYMKIIIDIVLNHKCFNFKYVDFEEILLEVSQTDDNTLMKFTIEKSLKHSTFNFKDIHLDKVLFIINSIHDANNVLNYFIEEALNHPTFNKKNMVYEILLTIEEINNTEFTEYFINQLVNNNENNEENFFDFQNINIKYFLIMISKIIVNNHNFDITEKLIQNILKNPTIIYNNINVERILLATNKITNINLVKYFPENLLNYKLSNFEIINFFNYLIIAIKNNHLEVIQFIFEKLLDFEKFSSNFKSIPLEKIILELNHYNRIEMMNYFFDKLLELKFVDLKTINFEHILLNSVQTSSIKYFQCLIDQYIKHLLFNSDSCYHQPINFKNLLMEIQKVNRKLELLSILMNDINFVKYLIQSDTIDINWMDNDGNTLLKYAIKQENEPIIHYLIQNGVDINKIDKFNESPLSYAFKRGNEKIIHFLMENGADIQHIVKTMDMDIIKTIIQIKDLNFLRILINNDNNDQINKKDAQGNNSLIYAIQYGNEPILNYLIDCGASFNDITLTMEIIKKIIDQGYLKLLKMIIENNLLTFNIKMKMENKNNNVVDAIDIENIDENDNENVNKYENKNENENKNKSENINPLCTSLIYAIKSGHKEIIQYLFDHGANLQMINEEIINYLKQHYDFDLLKLLVKNNFDINQKDKRGCLLLNDIISHGDMNELAKGLIDCGADVNIKDRYGKDTPLMYSIKSKNKEMVQYLLEHGADLQMDNDIIVEYIKFYHTDSNILKLLIDHGFNINQTDSLNEYLLNHFIIHHNNEIVKDLINYGTDVNIKDYEFGNISLIYAIKEKNLEIVQYIIDHGSEIHYFNKNGESPLFYAIMSEDPSIVNCLILNGASVDELNINMNIIKNIIRIGNLDLLKLILNKNPNIFNKKEKEKETKGKEIEEVEEIEEEKVEEVEPEDSILIYSFKYGNELIVNYLIDYGIKVDKNDITIDLMMKVIDRKNLNLFKILMEKILEKDGIILPTESIDRLFIYSIRSGNIDIVQYLIDYGANLQNSNDKIIEYIKFYFIINFDMIKILVRHGFNLNQKDENGEPFLNDIIITCNNEDTIKGLIDCGANINIYDEMTLETPLYCAIKSGKIEIVKYLIDHGANVHTLFKNNKTLSDINKKYNYYYNLRREIYFEIKVLLDKHNEK